MEIFRTEQRPASNIEVLHIGNADVVINRGTDHPELAEKALELIRQCPEDAGVENAPWEGSKIRL